MAHLPTNNNWSWNPSSDPTPTPAPDTAMQTNPPSSAMLTDTPTIMPFRPRPADVFTDIRATPAVNLANNLASTPTTPTTNSTPTPTTAAPTSTATHRYPLRSRGPPPPVHRAPRNTHGRSLTRRARRAKYHAEMNDFVSKAVAEKRMQKLTEGVGGLGVGTSGGEASSEGETLRMRDEDEERAWVESAKMTFRNERGDWRSVVGEYVPGQGAGAGRRRRAEERRRREAEGGGDGSPIAKGERGATPRLRWEGATVGSSAADTGMDMGAEGKDDAVVERGDKETPFVGLLPYCGIILSTDGHDFEVVQSGDEWTKRTIMDID